MNTRNLLRRCGYAEQVTRLGKISYSRRAGGGEFPRFHAYIDRINNGFTVNLHLDQKAACYSGTTAHSGEYDGELVEKEADYLKRMIGSLKMPGAKIG